jgi:hypothetical protein
MATVPFPTLTVIPAGFRWSQKTAEKAAEKNAFIRVGGQTVSLRHLSGAKRKWSSVDPAENGSIFHTGYRITGTPAAVAQALRYAGVAEDAIQQVLATAITPQNYQTTMAGEYDAEIARHQAAKARAEQEKPVTGYDWNQIQWFADNIKHAVFATKTGEQKGAVGSPGRAGRAAAGESLREKIDRLPAGKVLDVSNMDVNTGKGVRTIPKPGPRAKSGKTGTDRVPIISNDINKYVAAIRRAYGEQGTQDFALDIQAVREALARTGAPVAAVGLAPVPGANLAPVPTFGLVPQVRTPTAAVPTLGGGAFPAIPALGTLRM